jgi:hypothetical protein
MDVRRSIVIIVVSCTLLLPVADLLAFDREFGLGANLGFPQLVGVDVKYLFLDRHQLHFSYLVPLVHQLALGVNTDLSVGYTYRLEEEGVYTHFGGQLRYWRFDLDDSLYKSPGEILVDAWLSLLLGGTGSADRDYWPEAQMLFLGPQFGVERRWDRSALSFDLELLGAVLYTKCGEVARASFDLSEASLFPSLSVRYTYYF